MRDFLKNIINKHKKEVDYIEVRLEDSNGISMAISNREVRNMSNFAEYGGCVRACHKGGFGFVSFNNLKYIDIAIKNAIFNAKLVGVKKTILANVPVIEDVVKLDDLITDPRNFDFEYKLNLIKNYNAKAAGISKYVTSSTCAYTESFKTKFFVNSEGTNIEQNFMDLAFMVSFVGTKGNIIQNLAVTGGSSNNFDVFTKGIEEKIESDGKILETLLEAPSVKAGTYPVVINPVLGGVFVHESFGHTAEADSHMNNKKMGEMLSPGKVFGSEILSIYDSGMDRHSRAYYKYDDEGVKAEKTYLIKEGVLSSRLHTRETAGFFNEKVTGNARALNYKYAPICRMRNTCIENGNSEFKDMIKDIKEGIYAIDAMGGSGGESFTFRAMYGYMIRNGEIAEPVRNVLLTGNLFVTLKNIDMVGNDLYIKDSMGGCGKGGQFPLPVSHSSPHIRIKKVSVGGV